MYLGKRHIWVLSGLAILSLLIIDSCDPAFNPLAGSDKYDFSIYGYLDATADTQWVRVMPVRDSLFFSPRPINASVILKDNQSGRRVTMHDSLFQYYQHRYAHNFWTTMKLLPDRSYTLIAKQPDNPAHSDTVKVSLPKDYPTPRFYKKQNLVIIDSVKNLVDVSVIYHYQGVQGNSGSIIYPHIEDSSRSSGRYSVNLKLDHDLYELRDYQITYKQIYVAASGPGWPDFSMIDKRIESLPNGISNVKHGVGFVAGIISKTIPYKTCRDAKENVVPCP